MDISEHHMIGLNDVVCYYSRIYVLVQDTFSDLSAMRNKRPHDLLMATVPTQMKTFLLLWVVFNVNK